MIRYIDLFAGVGGFHYGIESAYDSVKSAQGSKTNENSGSIADVKEFDAMSVCVYSNEWDKYANSVYRRHYGQCDTRDIRKVTAEEIPDFDLLCGGFPCQSFSIAGKRGGFEDIRGTLFFEIARIVKEKQPRLLLLENVKGLLNHDQGRTFGIILSTLDELGYDAQWQVCNSKDFGVPQNRERVYIVGHLRGTPRPKVFPLTRTVREGFKTRQDEQHTEERVIQTRHLNQNGKLTSPIVRTLQASESACITDGTIIRRLTPVECERLQGFPDNWTEIGLFRDTKLAIELGYPERVKISDTQRYKMCGNAVTTNVITEIAKRLLGINQ